MKASIIMELIKRREDLVARISRERSVIAQNGIALRPLVNLAGKVNDLIHFIRSRPAYLLLPAVVMTAARPRRFLGMAISGIGLWRLARKWRRYTSVAQRTE